MRVSIFSLCLVAVLSMANSSFAQDADTSKTTDSNEAQEAVQSGISKEMLQAKLDSLRNALKSEYENKLYEEKNAHAAVIDSLNLSQQNILETRTREIRDAIIDSLARERTADRSGESITSANLYNYLSYLSEINEKELFENKVWELNNFVNIYRIGERSENAQLMLANLYDTNKNEIEAVASYVKFLFLYPASQKGDQARSNIIKITGKTSRFPGRGGKFGDFKDEFARLVEMPLQDKNYPAKYFDYIKTLYDMDVPDMRVWSLTECRHFEENFPDDEHIAQVSLWSAELMRKMDKNKEVAAASLKLIIGRPGSPLVPDALFLRASVQSEKLGMHSEAVENYNTLIASYPSHVLAPRALFDIATIQAEKLKQHPDAVRTYQQIVDAYSDSPIAVDALFAAGKVLMEKMNDPNGARDKYHLITVKYPNDPRGSEALEAAGKIAEKNKDYPSAISDYIGVYEKYPSDVNAVPLLLKAAEIQEKKTKDLQGAVSTLEIIEKKYPGYKDISKVQDKIKKLKEKIAKG